MSAVQSSSMKTSFTWGKACLVMLIAICLLDMHLQHIAQAENQSVHDEVASEAEPSIEQAQQASTDDTKAALAARQQSDVADTSSNKTQTSLQYLAVDLPPPPQTSKTIQALPRQQNESEPQPTQAPSSELSQEQAQAQIQQTMDALSELPAQQLLLTLPSSVLQREALLKHLYRCENMHFAVLQQSDKGASLMLLSEESANAQHSSLLRVVNGGLSVHELNLLAAYAPKGKPVRLFNQNMDWRLSQYLTAQLGDESLTGLKADYRLLDQSVYLVNIIVNNRMLQAKWQLSQGGCRT